MTYVVRDDPTVVQMKDALAAAGDVLIMGDDDEGASPPGRRRKQNGHHFDGGGRVEGSGGFVSEDNRRIDYLGPGNSDALSLAPRELANPTILHAA